MKRFLFWMGGLALFSLACAGSLALPTIDVQRAVELTVTVLSASLTNATPAPASQQPAPTIPQSQRITEQVTEVFSIQGCSINAPRIEVGLVTGVIDGDTIEVSIDGETYPLRYIGMDAAEAGEPYWNEGREYNQTLVEGQIVTLVQDVSARDAFDRLLRYVFLSDGTFVNEQLVRTGYAWAVAYPPDTACENRLNQAQREAQERKVGIWAQAQATDTPTPFVTGAIIQVDPSCSQFNAPGDDNQNKNEEYVCLTNPGSQPVGLTGWMIEDDYGWNYTFQTFSLESGNRVLLHTGCGTDSPEDLYWCRIETAIWNNGGDCVHLKDEQGELIQEYCY